ncbi:MAG: MFS transporter [Melioribacteraceae bacterium]|nr:MFS transporter [Melioribacteraceae bacterium]
MIRSIIKNIFQNKNLAMLFSGQLISQMGDSMFLIGLMWLVLEITGSKTSMGMVAMIAHIPNLTLALFAGVIVDSFNRKKIMIVSDLARAVIVLAIPITYYMGIISLPIIIATAFMLSTFSILFNPARDSVLPELVNKINLLKANSLIQSSNYAAILIGPIVAAGIVGLIGVANLFTIDAFTFFLSFITILFITYSPEKKEKRKLSSAKLQLKEIANYVFHDKKLRFLLILTAVNNFFIMGPAIVGIPIFVKDILQKDASTYALVESMYGIGMIAGSIFINYANKFMGKGKLLLWGMIFDGVTYAVLYFVDSTALMMFAIVIHAIGIPFIVVSRTAMIQEWTDKEKLGRVFSLVNIAVVGMTALTTGATGIIAEYIGIDLVFAVFGIAATLSGVIGFYNKKLREA